jgi:diacylglycerol kinase (CTP)
MARGSFLRNVFHFSGIIIPVAYLFTGRVVALWLSFGLFVLSGTVELLRLKGLVNVEVFRIYVKPKEARKPTGSFFYLLSATVVIFFFSREIAVSSLFILTIADPTASFIGRSFGNIPLAGKSLQGTLAFFAVALGILFPFPFPLSVCCTGAVAATLTELLTPKAVDDNLTIAIVTALFLQLALA